MNTGPGHFHKVKDKQASLGAILCTSLNRFPHTNNQSVMKPKCYSKSHICTFILMLVICCTNMHWTFLVLVLADEHVLLILASVFVLYQLNNPR